MSSTAGQQLIQIGGVLGDAEELYRDVHRHPELSMQEERTAALAARTAGVRGIDVTAGVGRTGVVGVLRNGDGPTVMLRADMDALPVRSRPDWSMRAGGRCHARLRATTCTWLGWPRRRRLPAHPIRGTGRS